MTTTTRKRVKPKVFARVGEFSVDEKYVNRAWHAFTGRAEG